jgi:hypothetical protein
MNAVIALTDLLLQERSSLNDEQIEHLEVIQTSGHHLLTVSIEPPLFFFFIFFAFLSFVLLGDQ